MRGGLRQRRASLRSQLAQRCSRVAHPQLGDLDEFRRQRIEPEPRGSLPAGGVQPRQCARDSPRRHSRGDSRVRASQRRRHTLRAEGRLRRRRPPPAGRAIASWPFAYAIACVRRSATASESSSRAATAARNSAPARVAVRSSRCGSRGPESEPPPSRAPRRYAARQHERPMTRFGGRSSGALVAERTPASSSVSPASTRSW